MLCVDILFHRHTIIIFYTIPKHIDKRRATWRQLKVPPRYKSVSFRCNNSQSAKPTSSLSLKRRPPKSSFSVPNKRSVARCDPYAKQCNSAQFILTPRLLCRRTVWASAATPERLLTHRSEEVVVALRELFRMQERDSNSCKMEKNYQYALELRWKVILFI
jgi:hypothetical protein